MSFKFSICYPDKEDIEYSEEILSADGVKYLALNYPWKAELQKQGSLADEQVFYSPSLDFTNQSNNYSFCLTALDEPKDFSFSVWFNRPVMKKVLFGLLGEKTELKVIDKEFSKEKSFALLDDFLAGNYDAIEQAMKD